MLGKQSTYPPILSWSLLLMRLVLIPPKSMLEMLEGNNVSSMRLKEPCFDPPMQTAISPCWASQTHEVRQSAVLLLLPALR